MCLIKTLLGKVLWDKSLVKEKEYISLPYAITCFIKNLVKKIQWDKTMAKGKKVQNIFISPPHVDNHP